MMSPIEVIEARTSTLAERLRSEIGALESCRRELESAEARLRSELADLRREKAVIDRRQAKLLRFIAEWDGGTDPHRVCPMCGRMMPATNQRLRWCSERCRWDAWNASRRARKSPSLLEPAEGSGR